MRNSIVSLLALALALGPAPASAATSSTIPQDTLKVGRKGTATDKVIQLDINQGVNNPDLRSNVTDQDLQLRANTVRVGKPTVGTKNLDFNIGASPTNPKIRYNSTTAKIEFSNNGTDFKAVGSGGASGGLNFLQDLDPDFEAGGASWSASGGSYTIATSGANWIANTRTAVFNSSASSQTLTSTAVTIASSLFPGLASGNGFVSCFFKTTATDYKIQAYDGTNVLGERTIPALGSATEIGAAFPIPSSGTVAIRIISASDAADLAVDNCYLGSLRAEGAAQAGLVASGYIEGGASCIWSVTSTVMAAFPTTANCVGPTVEFNPGPGTLITTDTDLPQFTVNNLPPGLYRASMSFDGYGSGTVKQVWDLYDGTTASGQFGVDATVATTHVPVTLNGQFSYTTSGNRTFQLRGASVSGSNSVAARSDTPSQRLQFSLYRFPTAAEGSFRFDQVANSWSGYHDSTCAWARTNVAYGDPTADTTCALVERTNTNFGTVVSALSGSDKLPGITWTPTRAGKYEVCASFASTQSSVNAQAAYQLTDGTTVVMEGDNQDSSATTGTTVRMHCGQYRAASTAAVTLKLQSKASAGSTTITNIFTGVPVIEWAIKQIDVALPAPLVVGGIVSSSSGVRAVEAAVVATTNDTTACTSGTCTLFNASSTTWLTATRASAGNYNLVFSGFSGKPVCNCSLDRAADLIVGCNVASSTTGSVLVSARASGTATDDIFSIQCSGPR